LYSLLSKLRIVDRDRNLKVNTVKANQINLGGRGTGNSNAFSEFDTAITMNASSGTITTPASTIAADTHFDILLTNDTITTKSIVISQVVEYGVGDTGEPIVSRVEVTGTGEASIRVYNAHASAALNSNVTVGFIVF
jgi:hypothetical protein